MKRGSFLESLRRHGRKRLPLAQVIAAFHDTHGEHDDHPNIRVPLLQALTAMEEDGGVVLPKSRKCWDRLGKPNLPQWVGIFEEPEQEASPEPAWLPELAAIVSSLTAPQRQVLAKINEYLIKHRDQLEPIPYRERSLKIFGDEHFLDSRLSRGALFQGRLPLQAIHAFEVYEPMPYERPPSRVTGRPVIVLENHHSFASFVKVNADQNAFSAVCFSSGNTLTRRERSLESIGGSVGSTEFLYLGDIDPPGITVPALCNDARVARGAFPLKPALGFYRWLMEHGYETPGAAHAASVTDKIASWFLSDNVVGQKALDLFTRNKRIAQESLDYSSLKQLDMASILT